MSTANSNEILDQGADFQDAQPVRMNPLQKLVSIVTAPSRAAAGIRTKPDVILPIILLVLASVAPFLINFQAYKDSVVTAMNAQASASTMTAEQLTALANTTVISTLAAAPFVTLIVWLLGALILFGCVRLFKGECRYSHILSLTGYAAVFSLLSGVLTAIVGLASGNGFLSTTLTSLPALVPDLPAGFVAGAATGIELFAIWSVIVQGIGVSVIAGIDRKKGFTIVGVLYVLELLFAGAMAGIGTALTAAFGG